jgi:O-6-methylguanine DNA methyltransferase
VVDRLELEVSEHGVRRVSFVNYASETGLRGKIPPRLFLRLVAELEQYFRGERKRFTVPLDITGGTPFQRRVWSKLIEIPYGQTWSYRRLAEEIGAPRAARAVGGANRANPLPILVPCHRVVCANGLPGGFSSGVHLKKRLLVHEGALTF